MTRSSHSTSSLPGWMSLKLLRNIAIAALALAACAAPETQESIMLRDSSVMHVAQSGWRSQISYDGNLPFTISATTGTFMAGDDWQMLPSDANSIILGNGNDNVNINVHELRGFSCDTGDDDDSGNIPSGIYADDNLGRTIHIQTRNGNNRVTITHANPDERCLRIDWDDAAGLGGNSITVPLIYVQNHPRGSLLGLSYGGDHFWTFERNEHDLVFFADALQSDVRVWTVLHGLYRPENLDQPFMFRVVDENRALVMEINLQGLQPHEITRQVEAGVAAWEAQKVAMLPQAVPGLR